MLAKQAASELALVRDTFKSVARANDLKDFNSFLSFLERHGERDANELVRSLASAIAEPVPTENTDIPKVQTIVASLAEAGSDRVEFGKVAANLVTERKAWSLAALNLVAAGYIGAVKNHRTKKAALEAISDHFETLVQRARKSREIDNLTGSKK